MELRVYLEPLRKWWWLIVVSTVIAGATSYAAVSQQPPVYQARVALLIGSAINNPNPNGNEFWLSQQLAQTYSDIAQRGVVRQAVMDQLGLTWLPEYSAQPVANTQLLELRVTDSNPERATAVANELANQLILRTPASSNQQGDAARQAFIGQQLDDLEAKIGGTEEEIVAKQTELAGLFSARQIADAQNQIRALEAKQDTLQANYAALLASTAQGAANSLSIIEPATLPRTPVGPEVMMTVLTAAAIGMSLGIGAAYLLEYLDDTVKSPEDVRRVAGLATLTGIAEHKSENGDPYELLTLKQPRSPISEAYRALRTAILFANVDEQIRVILITSPNPGEGKSLTAANLAVVMAQAGHRVLLVDADLRRPKQQQIFEVAGNYGLTNLLVGITGTLEATKMVEIFLQINRAVLKTEQKDLYLLTTGPVPPNPAEVIGSAKMKMLLELLATRFDYVIVDSPPVLVVTDAVILSTRVDSVLLVTSSGITRHNQFKQAIGRLQEVKASLAGVVLNRLAARNGDYYYHKGYYSDGFDDDQGSTPVTPVKRKQRPSERARRPLPDFLMRFLS